MNLQPHQRRRRSSWKGFYKSSLSRTAKWLYWNRPNHKSSRSSSPSITVVCISDTHCTQPIVSDGDVLLHAGDLSEKGTFTEIQSQLDWLKSLPHKYKVVIGGNHDLLLDPEFVSRFPERIIEEIGTSRSDLDWGDIIYLNNSSTTLNFLGQRRLKIYGSPLTEQFGTWAFQYPPIRNVWNEVIPADTDILLTHGPPLGHLDRDGLGSRFLLKDLCRVKPRLVVFGHIHAGYGREDVRYDWFQSIYDGVMLGEKGFGALVGMVVLWLFRWLVVKLEWRDSGTKEVTFVNAAMVGGIEDRLRRSAIIVDV